MKMTERSARTSGRVCRLLVGLALVLSFAGCATSPFNSPLPSSLYSQTEKASFKEVAADPLSHGQTGRHYLDNGILVFVAQSSLSPFAPRKATSLKHRPKRGGTGTVKKPVLSKGWLVA